jgi:predicted neuraminidase
VSVATPAAAPWRQCHASTLIQGAEGDMLVAFFAGTREGAEDNAIYLARGVARHPGAEEATVRAATGNWSWSEPEQLTQAMGAHWNPVLARSPLGKLTLFFKRGRPISQWQTWRVTSEDDGHSWSPAGELVPGDRGGRGPVKNPPVVLSSGRWVAGASTEAGGSGGVTSTWDCFADISDDDGDTWTRSENIPIDHSAISGPGVIQPAVWNGPEGVVFLMRSSTGRAWRSVSVDGGVTWSPAEETDLPSTPCRPPRAPSHPTMRASTPMARASCPIPRSSPDPTSSSCPTPASDGRSPSRPSRCPASADPRSRWTARPDLERKRRPCPIKCSRS